MQFSTKLAEVAVIDHRMGEPGEQCYGFVWFREPGTTVPDGLGESTTGSETVRIGYTTPPPGKLADLWQGNWGAAFPVHFQAAADVLIEAGILRPRDGKILVQTTTDDEPRLVDASTIDRELVVKWVGKGQKTGVIVRRDEDPYRHPMAVSA
jgi:hypothetical protein